MENGMEIFSFFDAPQRLVQVFDESGKTLIQAPIECDVSPLFGLRKSNSDFGIYSFRTNNIVFTPIKY
jgi:hypothetical protein